MNFAELREKMLKAAECEKLMWNANHDIRDDLGRLVNLWWEAARLEEILTGDWDVDIRHREFAIHQYPRQYSTRTVVVMHVFLYHDDTGYDWNEPTREYTLELEDLERLHRDYDDIKRSTDQRMDRLLQKKEEEAERQRQQRTENAERHQLRRLLMKYPDEAKK